MTEAKTICLDTLAKDLAEARKEVTLADLTNEQWYRVCNRIANCLHKQLKIDWDAFMQSCGCPKISQD